MAWAAARDAASPVARLLKAFSGLGTASGSAQNLPVCGTNTISVVLRALQRACLDLESDLRRCPSTCTCLLCKEPSRVCSTPYTPQLEPRDWQAPAHLFGSWHFGAALSPGKDRKAGWRSPCSPSLLRQYSTGPNGSIRDSFSAAAESPLTPDQVAQHAAESDDLDPMEEMLDKWGKLLDEGDTEGVMQLLEEELGGGEDLPPVHEMLAQQEADVQAEKAARRDREVAVQEEFARSRVRVVDQLGRAYATGKRKTSVARVWVREGRGQVRINGRPLDQYFGVLQRRADVLAPFQTTASLGKFDVMATVKGGGTTGQAQAVRHGIARALQLFDPELRPALKAQGLLTRDARIVERKKPGKAKARKSFQWVKR